MKGITATEAILELRNRLNKVFFGLTDKTAIEVIDEYLKELGYVFEDELVM